MPTRQHIAIVGAGVVGLAIAHRLAGAGARVTVLERDRVGRGCSAANLGWICPSISLPLPAPGLRSQGLRWFARPDSPLYIRPAAVPALTPWLTRFWSFCNRRAFDEGGRVLTRFAGDAVELYQELAGGGPEEGRPGDDRDGLEWWRRGLLMVFRHSGGLESEIELVERFGYGPLERIGRDDLRELEPALPAGRYAGGLLIVPEAHVEPRSVTAALATRSRQLGVEIREGFRVDALVTPTGSRRIRAVAGKADGERVEIEADQVVVATGAEAGRLAAVHGCQIPLQAGKGYSITVTEPELELRRPVYLAERKLGFTPFAGALRTAGTLELSGINTHLDRRRLAAIERVAERGLPGATHGKDRRDWVGMRPITPDGLPVLGRLPATDNVWLATGHQMLGMTLAPATGRLLAALLLGARDPGLEPADRALFEKAFAPERFA